MPKSVIAPAIFSRMPRRKSFAQVGANFALALGLGFRKAGARGAGCLCPADRDLSKAAPQYPSQFRKPPGQREGWAPVRSDCRLWTRPQHGPRPCRARPRHAQCRQRPGQIIDRDHLRRYTIEKLLGEGAFTAPSYRTALRACHPQSKGPLLDRGGPCTSEIAISPQRRGAPLLTQGLLLPHLANVK